MSNTAPANRDSHFWHLQDNYRRFALQRVKAHLQDAGHRGSAFHYYLLSMGLLLKTFQKTPRLREIITCFEGAFSINKVSAPSKALQLARGVSLEGLQELAGHYADTNLEHVNEEAYGYWCNELQRLERQQNTAVPQEDARRDRRLAKFLVKYYTLKSELKRMEPDFTIEQIRLEATKSRALDPGERDNEAVEAIGRRRYPELFSDEQQQTAAHLGKATKGKDVDFAALGLEKHAWLGTQFQLAELYIELERKGWIKEKKPKTIKACFTNSNTIEQVIKPGYDMKEATYTQVYTENYRPVFDGIKKNRKKS